MGRKVKKTIRVFNENVEAEEQYYLGNEALPTFAQYTYTQKMADALKRCKDDICYFAEHFFTIIDKTVRKKIPLREYQKRVLLKMQQEKRLIMLTSRQCGKTTLMTIYALWLAMFFPDQAIRIIANKRDRAIDDLDRIHLAYEEMENWVKQPVEEGTWNKGSIKFANGSVITALATSASSARGDTISCILLDELGFVEENIAQEFWRSVGPTLSSNPEAQMFIASTPKGEGNLLWDLCTKSDKGENDYVVERIYWYEIPGRDNAWKEQVLKNDCNGDINYFEQEYECRFLGSTNSPFEQRVFDRLGDLACPPKDVVDNGRFSIWRYPENARVYSIGVDVAEGIGQDYSVIQVMDLTDLTHIEQCACFRDNKTNPTDFSLKVAEIAEMYGNPVLSVERNSCGVEVCNKMAIDFNYPRFVNWGLSNNLKRQLKNGVKDTFRYGVICTQNTRRPAVTNLKYWLADKSYVYLYDERFLAELRNFEIHKTTHRWAAAPGFHDDIIMATTWALNVLHSRLVETEFIVEKWDINNPAVPAQIANRFSYKIDKNELATKFGRQRGFQANYPVMAFGFRDQDYEQQQRFAEARKAGIPWSCFLYDGEPLQ